MTLEKYNKKRNFEKTSEPKGESKGKRTKKLIFVIQHHKATADHYDLRLEHNGVLLSFAVPKGLPKLKNVKRLAVMVEDHPLEYAKFEGVIPKGNYGAGVVEIFDKGTYIQLNNFDEGLNKGTLKFFLNGEVLKGSYSLVKMDKKNWLVIKSDDEYVEKSEQKPKKTTNPFKTISPMLATLSNQIPTGKKWSFEIKYDGYRIIALKEGKKVKLLSRNGNDYTKKFEKIAKSIEKIAREIPFVLDGEVVCFNSSGASDFGLLQQNIKNNKDNFTYVVFDLLALNGKDLRTLPLLERKEHLKNLLDGSDKNILFSSHVIGNGKKCFKMAKDLNLEGIIAKKIDSKYVCKRSEDWLKIKCYKRQEFVIVGYLTSEKNKILSAILVGYYAGNKLVFAGKVGTGFSLETKKELVKKFNFLKSDKCYLSEDYNIKANWIKPELVAEIKFAEFTKDNILRQPSFVGLREDKEPKSVVMEQENGNKD